MTQRHLVVYLVCIFAISARMADADFTFVVPQRPGGGTSLWAQIVASELEKKLGERIIIRHLPGARDIIAFNKFHNELRFDDETVMVSHGGNAIAFLQERVDYDFACYDPVAIMNNNIILAIRNSVDWRTMTVTHAEGSGMTPEGMAIALLVDGPEAPANWKKKAVWVKGMTGAERRLAFRRGELNTTRDNPAAFKKHIEPLIAEGKARIWFHHGMLDMETGLFGPDPNFDAPTFEELYKQTWGEMPSGDLYDAYKMAKAWRDGVQKALWVNEDNPNRQRLVVAVRAMLADDESRERLNARLGVYPWQVGDDAERYMERLHETITEKELRTLVDFNTNELELASYYNENRIYGVSTGNQKGKSNAAKGIAGFLFPVVVCVCAALALVVYIRLSKNGPTKPE